MSIPRQTAKRALRGVGLGFLVDARRAWIERRGSSTGSGVDRAALARRHLCGEGLEIGALHTPIPVPADVVVRFVDLFSKADNVARFPDLPPDEIIEPDVLEDGFELCSVETGSQDFVIASHVLEHSPNPIGVLENWSRVTRAGGVLYVIVPVAERCFDAGREATTLAHWVEDAALYARGDRGAIRDRNRHHYLEWIRISERQIFQDQGHAFEPPSEEAVEMRLGELLEAEVEIHFHTFSEASFRELLEYFCREGRPGSRVVDLRVSDHEVLGVVELG